MNHDIDVKQFIKECDECVSWETLKDQGRHHFQQGRYGEAMACYQRAIKHARPTQGSKKILIQLHNNLAECALRRYDALTAQQETQTILEGEEEEEGAHKIEEIQIQKAFHRYLRSLELQKQIVTLEGKENDSIGRYLRRHWKALQPMKTRLTEILQRLQQYNIWEHVSKEMARSYESTTRHDYRRESLVGKGVLPDAFSGSQFLHSPDGIDENLLILFHGVGDTPDPFVTFAKTLSLPQTAILALKGPKKIPFVDTGFAWVDSFEPATFEPIPMNIHHKSRYQSVMSLRKLLDDLIARIVGCWNIRCERIHYLGFSQGGTVALDHALHAREGYWPGTCIAVNSILLPELMANDQNLLHHDTQIVMTFGDTDQILPQTLQKQTVCGHNLDVTTILVGRMHRLYFCGFLEFIADRVHFRIA